MDRVPRSGTRIVYEDRSVTFRHQDRIWIGATFRYQDSMMKIGVSRSDTRIVYEDRSVTFRHQDSLWIGCHVPVPE